MVQYKTRSANGTQGTAVLTWKPRSISRETMNTILRLERPAVQNPLGNEAEVA